MRSWGKGQQDDELHEESFREARKTVQIDVERQHFAIDVVRRHIGCRGGGDRQAEVPGVRQHQAEIADSELLNSGFAVSALREAVARGAEAMKSG